MNVLFLSISNLINLDGHSISKDLLREFVRNGHSIYIVSSLEQRMNQDTYLSDENGCKILHVRIGNNKKANNIIKGLTSIFLPRKYISAIGRYYADIQFDLVLYPTPPITQVKTIEYIKKRDGAKSYLLLKDIFPQNAVDIGLMQTRGIRGIIYKHFRRIEKKLYSISDHIGCMSQANVDYVVKHNPELRPNKIEICPNAIEIIDNSISEEERISIRTKYGIPQKIMVFIYGGNLGKPQGIPYIIECLRQSMMVSEAYFLIVGDGTEYSKLEHFIEDEKPTNIKLIKKLPKKEYDTLVAACDTGLIFLDHRFTIPNFPSRLLGYMQAKLPVLACTDPNTDIGETIIKGGFGWWCESNNPKKFVDLVLEIVKTNNELKKEAAYTYLSDHYSAEKTYQTIIQSVGN